MDDSVIRSPAFQVVGPPASATLIRQVTKALSGFRIPRNVTAKTGISSLDDIRERWLIVVCTPETPEDPETCRAIDEFLLAGKRNRILTLLAEGTPERSFPESLVRETLPDGTVKEYEPLAANITAESPRRSLRLLNVERFRLLAPMLGVSFDDLMNRDLRRRKNILLTSGILVLTGAVIFLCFAITRMRTIRGQNEQLKKEYEDAEQAREEAEAERDAAGETLARTVALSAGSLLEEGDTELSLLLCLEYLPGMKHISELTDVFEKALSVRCRAGFSSVTTSRAYERTRGFEPSAYSESRWEILGAVQRKRPEGLSDYIDVPLPGGRKDASYLGDHASPKLSDWSEEDGTAVYLSELPYGSPGNIEGRHSCLWITRFSEPEQGFWLREKDGTLVTGISSARFLYDGSVLAAGETVLRRFAFPDKERKAAGEDRGTAEAPAGNALAGSMEEIPVYDGGTALREEIPFPITFFMEKPGFADRIHGLARHGAAVFEKEPFRLLFLIQDEHTEVATTAPDGSSYWNGVYLAVLPDGGRRMVIGERYVYDEKDGSFLFEIDDHGQSTPFAFLDQSSEGWLPQWFGGELVFTDLADGHTVDVIRSPSGNRHSMYGPPDALGNAGASLVLVYLDYDRRSIPERYYWEYREKEIPVPEDLDGQIALAKKLLNGRGLIPAERRKYHLDLQ